MEVCDDSGKTQDSEDNQKKSQNNKQSIEENLIDILARNSEPLRLLIGDLADKWLNLQTNEKDFQKKMVEGEFQFNQKMVYVVFTLVVFIILASGILTFVGKIDGASFTFLLGLILGYMLSFIKEISLKNED